MCVAGEFSSRRGMKGVFHAVEELLHEELSDLLESCQGMMECLG